MKKLSPLLFLLFSVVAFSQPITVNSGTYTVPQLIQDILINSQCAQVSNITWRTGNTNGQNSENGIGYFQNTNPNFPIQSGVILSTGRATSAPGPNTGTLSQGTNSWTGDNDLKTQMVNAGVVNNSFTYRNASYIEFNFTPLTTSFSFNFLFASEEYGLYQCDPLYADAFAFILTNTLTGQSTNLAVVPGTSIPISSIKIKDQAYNSSCPSQNASYFGMYYPENGFPPAPIHFIGRTTLMSASATVVPNTPYKIKLVIADGDDTQFDSAVFLQAGSFNVGQASLGGDLTIDNLAALCPGEIRTLSTGLDPAHYTFQWTQDGDIIPGATGPSYGVSEPGLYGVIINNIGGACMQQPAPVRVEVFPPIAAGTPVDLTRCGDGTNPVSFNLNENYATILAGLDPATIISYHTSLADAQVGANYVPDPTNFQTATSTTIYVNVATGENNCFVIRQFDVKVISCTADPVQPDDLTLCDIDSDGVEAFDLTQLYTTILGGQDAANYNITFHTSQANADNNVSPITPANAFVSGTQTVYVRMERVGSPAAYGTTSFQVIVKALPQATISGPVGICKGSSAIIIIEGTPGATVNYTVNGSPESVILDAAGNASILTPPITADVAYALVSVVSNDTAPQCTQNLTGVVSITAYDPPTATISGDATICSGDTAVLTFNGTPNATVTYNDGTADATVLLDATGAGTATVGPLTTNTSYSLVRVIASGSPACMAMPAGSVTITVNPLPTATISAPARVCFGDPAVVSVTGPVNGVVTYSDGTTTATLTLDATGNANFTTAALTAPVTYSLISVTTDPAVTPVCSQNQTGSVTIGVQDLPVATVTGPASVCEGSTADIVFNGTPNATVTYTFTGNPNPQEQVILNSAGTATVQTPALTGPITYQLISVSATTNGLTCSQPQNDSHTVTTVVAPTINNPSQLDICDSNNDGFETFDLSVKIAEITGGNTALTVTFHETPQDAQLGNYPITMPLYTNINPYIQTLYIRVVNTGVNACASFSTLTLVVHDRPVVVPNVTNYELCETSTPGDGFEIFNLTTKDAEVIGTQTGITVSYYTSQAFALAGTNPILNAAAYQNGTNPQTIWYQLKNAAGCIAVGSFDLIVNPLPTVPNPVPAYTLCDYTGQALYEQFDLSTKIPEIIGSTTGLDVKFYRTQAEAQAGAAGTELPTLYTNEVATVQTIFVRVTNSTTGCYSITAMDLRVEPLPVLVMPATAVTTCDGTNNDGIGDFDLTTLTTAMLNGETNVVISFHETQQNAQNGLFPITVMPYQNINPWNQTLWVLATNTVTGCKSVYSFQLQVEPAPKMPALLDLAECDTDSNPHDNQTFFDLTVHTATILAEQPGAAADYEVNYFISEANAIAGTPFIVSNANFIGTNNQVIWVRVTHKATGCYTIGNFKLIVNNPLQLTQPDEITLCDDALPNDQRQIFDLTIRESQITGGATGYTFNYYSSTALPPNPATLITTPTAYQNQFTVQTLLVEVVSGAGCSSYVTLTIRVTPLPIPKFDPAPLVACDDDFPGDGITFFDVTVNADYIKNNQPNYVLTYHATQADALAGVNAIATPTHWQNADANGNAVTSVWVRVTTAPANNRDRCSLVVEQPLIVNPLPAAGPVSDYHICQENFTGNDVFDFNTKTPEVLAGQGPAGYTVSYHATQADAQSGAAALPTTYPSSGNETIWVRVVNTTTGCYNTTSFDLFVDQGSKATDIADITQCDDLDDGQESFDLSSYDADILGPVQAADPNYSVSYYASDADLANDNPIDTSVPYVITDFLTHEIIAVVKNTYSTYGCPAEIRFNITVNPLPHPTPNAGFVCIDQETGTVLNTHIIDSGLAPADHTFEWYEIDSSGNAQLIAGATGSTYEVNHPGTYSVIAIHNVTTCRSLPVSVVITQSEPAEVSAYVSNAFEENQTITVEAIGIGEYVYQLDEGAIQTSPVFTNVSPGAHTVTVYDMKGCESVTIPVNAINYPHYFTPNGDGYHDTWNIGDLENDPNAKIYIFDRYGKLLKQIKPSRIGGWDGTVNGQPLPATDYWFTTTYTDKGDIKEFKAHFSLKR